MKIADLELGDKPLFLAPMEDVTDPSFRSMCKEFGADVVYTEFISSDGLIRDAAKSLKKLEITEAERPVGIQIYGHLIVLHKPSSNRDIPFLPVLSAAF